MRVRNEVDEGAEYEVVKKAMLKVEDETAEAYGYKVFELTGEKMKTMSGDEIVDAGLKLARGLFQECSDVEECAYVLAKTIIKQGLPVAGRIYLDNRECTNVRLFREHVRNWRTGRAPNNFYKPLALREENRRDYPGRGYREREYSDKGYRERDKEYQERSYGRENHVRDQREKIVCQNCGKFGHKAPDCRVKPQQGNGLPRPPVSVCYVCKGEGHRSYDCPSKKGPPERKREHVTARVAPLSNSVKGNSKENVVEGKVNGRSACILLDSGADVGMVPRALIGSNPVNRGEIILTDAHKNRVTHRCTEVNFDINGNILRRVVAIDEDNDESPVNCILPVNLRNPEESAKFIEASLWLSMEGMIWQPLLTTTK